MSVPRHSEEVTRSASTVAGPSPAERLEGRRLGRYKVECLLGRGGMASVWRAHDSLQGRTVALKVLSENLSTATHALHRFRREAELARLLDHPSIAPIYDTGEVRGRVFIAMALIEGETLDARIARSQVPVSEATRVVRLAASALSYAHECGIVHRDVTSRNIMLASDGRVLVLDFGLALLAGASRVTSSNTIMGTPGFVAPEVLQGADADPRGDIYGLGVVLYHALTGRLPYRGERIEAIQFEAIHSDPLPPSHWRPEVPPALDAIAARSLARDLLERYPSVEVMIRDLEPVSDARPSAALAAERARALADLLRKGGGLVHLALPDPRSEGGGDELETAARSWWAAIAASLSEAGRIHVLPSPGIVRSPEDIRERAARLGANAVLDGHCRARGARVRVVLALIEPGSGARCDGAVVEGTLVDGFDLEDRIVAAVRRLLGQPEARIVVPAAGAPPDPAAREHFVQALQYLERHDHEASVDGAITLLERLAISRDAVPAVHAALARAYLRKRALTQQHVWIDRACEACERARQGSEDAPEVLVALGDLHAESGRHDLALQEYRRASGARPDLVDAVIGEARVLLRAGAMDEAEAACQRALALAPMDWRAYSVLGYVFYKQGRYAHALAPWRRVLDLTPNNAIAFRNVGSALFHLDQYDEALDAFAAGLRVSQNADAYTNYGTVLFFLERYSEAVSAFEKAVAIRPADPILWGNLGDAQRWIPGLEDGARTTLERAIGLMKLHLDTNPKDAQGWASLAGWHSNRGEQPAARSALERALALAPRDVGCLVKAGYVLLQLGERDAALGRFEQAVGTGYGVEALRRSPELRVLNKDPRFQALLARDRDAASHSNPRRSVMAAKKKAGRKKSTKIRKRNPITKPVRIYADRVVPPTVVLSVSCGDSVEFINRDDVPVELHFTDWPFRTGRSPMSLDPGEAKTRQIKVSVPPGKVHEYTTKPKRNGPPTPPEVVAGD